MVCWGPQGDRPSVLLLGPPGALGFCMESGVQRRLKVTRWTAGSQWGLSQLPRLHPSSRPSAAGVGRRGSWAPTGAFSGHRGTVLCSSTVPLFALCQAAASLNPADEEEPVPASTNTCGFWREAVPGSLTQWVDLKAQRAVTGQGRAQAGVPLNAACRVCSGEGRGHMSASYSLRRPNDWATCLCFLSKQEMQRININKAQDENKEKEPRTSGGAVNPGTDLPCGNES